MHLAPTSGQRLFPQQWQHHNDIMGDGIETRKQKQMCRVLGARGGEKEEERKRKGGNWSGFPGQACEERANCDRGPQNILNVAKGTEDRRRHTECL